MKRADRKSDVKKCAHVFGENGFVFLDERPWPYLVTDKSGAWWLYYWSEGNKNFVTMRALSLGEVDRLRLLALPPSKAVLYAELSKDVYETSRSQNQD